MKKNFEVKILISLVTLLAVGFFILFSAFYLIRRQERAVPPHFFQKESIFQGNISRIGPEEFWEYKKEKGVFLTEKVLRSDRFNLDCNNIYIFSYKRSSEEPLYQNVLVVIAETLPEKKSMAQEYLNALFLAEEKLAQETIKPLPFVTLSQEGGFELQDISKNTIGQKSVLLNYKGKRGGAPNYILGFLKKNVLVILFSGGKEANFEFLEELGEAIEKEI